MYSINISRVSIYKKQWEDAIKKWENEVIKLLKSKIKDFSTEEFIEKIKKRGSCMITEYYSEWRYLTDTNWINEMIFFDLFKFLWDKNKKKDDYIIEDAFEIYDKIVKIEDNGEYIWDLDKIDVFWVIIKKIKKIAWKDNTSK